MQGASRTSLAELREALPSGDVTGVAGDLFAVTDLLHNQGSLRRTLADPATEGDRKVTVADRLLTGKVGDATLDVVRRAVQARWSASVDLVDALETVAVDAALSGAEADGSLDEVEDELFRFGRILAAEPDLRDALTNRNLPGDRKRQLLERLLEGRTAAVTRHLIERVVLAPRGRTIERALDELSTQAAQRRERLIAHVTAAVELTEAEREQLAATIARTFGHQVKLQVVVDPSLLGGLTVRVGDEVIDASVARQLAEMHRKLRGGATRRTA